MQKKLKQHNNKNTLTLYSVVFESVSVKCAVAFLFLFFVLNPAVPAFAADEEEAQAAESEVAEEVQEVEEETEEQVEESDGFDEVSDSDGENSQQEEEESGGDTDIHEVEIDSIENEDNSSAEIEDESEEQVVDESESEEENATENESADDVASTTAETSENTDQDIATTTDDTVLSEVDTGSDSATTSFETATSSATTTEQESVSSESGENNNENETTEISEDETEDETDTEEQVEDVPEDDEEDIANSTSTSTKATSTPQTATSTSEAQVSVVSFVQNNMNAHQFADSDCVSVGEGAFYCSQGSEAEDFIENGVYSAPDNDGDLEIFIHIDGEDRQISDNKVDDSAPHYDSYSNKIVWHSLIQDRYQIVMYDVQSGEQEVLTETSYNNMEPVAYQGVVLWQAWIGGNWEIMRYENSSTTQLTDNKVHDVTPSMRGGYILWQTQFIDGWRVAAYDAESGSVEYIGESEGSLIENPRMVLVYDSTNETGDVTTLGYDFDSKSSFIIENIPTDIPEKLPEPDQTGETRALIQSKSTLREVGVEDDADSQATTTNSVKNTNNATSTESVFSLDLSTSTSTDSVASTTSPQIEDVVIEPLVNEQVEENASSTDHLEDLVIPQISTSTEEEIS